MKQLFQFPMFSVKREYFLYLKNSRHNFYSLAWKYHLSSFLYDAAWIQLLSAQAVMKDVTQAVMKDVTQAVMPVLM